MKILSNSDNVEDEHNNPNKNLESKKTYKNKEKKEWKRLDDIHLIELTEKYNLNWKKIASIMQKPESVIKARYEKRLNPRLIFTKFTPEEDALIIKLYKLYGSTWNNISKYLPNRSSIMIKNRFYSNLKKRILEENNSKISSKEANLAKKPNPWNSCSDLICLDVPNKLKGKKILKY